MSGSDPKTPAKRNTAFKIKLRGKDGAPLRMPELQQGFYDIARCPGRGDLGSGKAPPNIVKPLRRLSCRHDAEWPNNTKER